MMIDEPWRLPDKWAWTELGEIADAVRSQVNPSLEPEKKFDYLSIENVESQSGELVNFEPTLGREIKSAKIAFTGNDLLYSKLRPYLNKVHLPTFDGISATDLIPIRPRGGILREYLAYFLRSRFVLEYVNQRTRGIQLPRVPVEELLRLPIPLAPLNQQKLIVAKVDALIRRLRQASTSIRNVGAFTERLRQSVLLRALRGDLTERNPTDEPAVTLLEKIRQERRTTWEELRFKGKHPGSSSYREPPKPIATNLPSLPDSWCWASADELCLQITDGEHITPKREKSGVYLLSARNVLDGRIVLDDVDHISVGEYRRINKRVKPAAGDVLLTCSGTIGRSCPVPEGLEFAMVRSVALLRPSKYIHGEYLSFALRSPVVQNQIQIKKTQTAQSNIFQGKIRTLMIPLAPLKEQEYVISQINTILSRVGASQIVATDALHSLPLIEQSILSRVFHGELVPQDPRDDSASTLLERIEGLVSRDRAGS